MKYLIAALTSVIVSGCLCVCLKASSLTEVPSAGMWCQMTGTNACDSACQDQLTRSLQRLTGWSSLQFNAAGKLVIPAPEQCEQGSAAARRIIEAVGQRPDVFWIENHARSERVNFGQLNEGLDYEDLQSGRRCTVWQVRLDLADFAALQAPRSVRAAFEVGFIFLHELLHGLGYQDAHSWEAVGECEETINRIRGELGLPIREHYFAESFELARGFVSAKLLFKRFTPKGKARTEWLFFKPGTETYVEARGPQANDARSTQAAVRQRH